MHPDSLARDSGLGRQASAPSPESQPLRRRGREAVASHRFGGSASSPWMATSKGIKTRAVYLTAIGLDF